MKKFYIASIVPEVGGGYSVYFPDLPSVEAGGETVEEAIGNATSNLHLTLRDMAQRNIDLPEPSSLDEVHAKVKAKREADKLPYPENTVYQFFAIPRMNMEPVRLNISLPKFLVEEMDAEADFLEMTRSGLIHEATQEYITKGREGRKVYISGFMVVQEPCGPDWQNGIYEVIKGLRKKGWKEVSPQIYFYTYWFTESASVDIIVQKIKSMLYPVYFENDMIKKEGIFNVEIVCLMNSHPVFSETIAYQYKPGSPTSIIMKGINGIYVDRDQIEKIALYSRNKP